MKIKKIQLKNIGPYVDYNGFDFDIADSVKRMVLVNIDIIDAYLENFREEE